MYTKLSRRTGMARPAAAFRGSLTVALPTSAAMGSTLLWWICPHALDAGLVSFP